MSSKSHHVLIVGGGAAGFTTADALRRQNFDGKITVIGDEGVIAYDRPPLSKQFLTREWPREKTRLFPPARYERMAADIRRGTAATQLDPDARTVTLSSGEVIGYDDVVIATGVTPRRLPGSQLAGVHVLRTIGDSEALADDLSSAKSLVVVGGGLIGLEVAASATALGVGVTVVEPMPRPMADKIGGPTAERLLQLHRDAGVRILHAGVAGLEADASGRVSAVALDDGTVLESDCVLVAIGCQPAVDWLADSGLQLSNGVVCDEYCAAAPGVWAVGDVARWHHLDLGYSVRWEHRTNATDQGRAVAKNILGAGVAYTPIPYFWTDQYDVKVQALGFMPDDAVDECVEGDPDGKSFVRTFKSGGRLVGVVAWNAPRAITEYRDHLESDEAAVSAVS